MKNKMYLLFISLVVLIALFIYGIEVFHTSEKARLDFLSTHNSEHFVRPHSPIKGAETAKVFVTEFLDPECESCRAVFPFVKKLLQDYDGKIKVVIRYVPFHKNSETAIRMLEAARLQGKYWETLEVFFRNQPVWGSHHDPRPDLLWSYLPELGIDSDRLKKDMERPEIQNIIDTDRADAQKIGVRGTPTFFVNGKPLEQFGPVYLKQAIDEALKNN